MTTAKWQFILVLEEGKRSVQGRVQNNCQEAGSLTVGRTSQGLPVKEHRNFHYTVQPSGEVRGCHTASPDLEHFFVLFADRTRKALLWKGSTVKSGHCRFLDDFSELLFQSNWNLFG